MQKKGRRQQYPLRQMPGKNKRAYEYKKWKKANYVKKKYETLTVT